jgi:hypothetical protein
VRNTEDFRRSPKPKRSMGVGFTSPSLDKRKAGLGDVGTVPGRHFTPIATNIQQPERITVDLEPYGEREVIDGRD